MGKELKPPVDTTTLEEIRARMVQCEQDGLVDMARAYRLRLRTEGRRLAEETGYEWGWCSFHDQLHPEVLFGRRAKSKSGLNTYCAAARSEHKRGVKTATKPIPRPSTGAGTRKEKKCRKCKRMWTPADGDKKERCPTCRIRKPRREKREEVKR